MHYITVHQFHYRRELMITAIRCVEKKRSVPVIGKTSCEYWVMAKNIILCIQMSGYEGLCVALVALN